jgi:hypothetical protein
MPHGTIMISSLQNIHELKNNPKKVAITNIFPIALIA